ncbi:hypothetical protein SAMN03159338_1475 [Sphingomonas sp. NFR04]|uniref:hypothetical protein n=1 Tax=Sphingomonas sp. NFR04 TaxID=1566283 RepID=UPI0008F42F93|nr:hypothetical protein [Sphingomonas sp. NFR04]SFJ46957.1 hypothetical protein SAMN03159338_1475 [Sphingomonas sp. NFR04]
MKTLRPESPPGGVRYRLSFTKPGEMENGRACRVYCEEEEADECIVELSGVRWTDWRFGRSERDPKQWDSDLQYLLDAFQHAFAQGVTHQKNQIRDQLRELIGL